MLALDRLVLGLDGQDTTARLNPFLDTLFKDAQSLPDFNPAQFAAHLEEFQRAIGE